MQSLKKKLFIIGSTGLVGKQLVSQSLERGYHVTALARNPSSINIKNENLEVVKGEVSDLELLEKHFVGKDAILTSLGGPTPKDDFPTIRTDGAKNVAKASEKTGVKRFLVVGGASLLRIDDSKRLFELPGLPDLIVKLNADHKGVWDTLAATDLDWTIFCPPHILEGERSGKVKVTKDLVIPGDPMKIFIYAADLASIILDELEKREYIRSLVGVATES